MNTALAHFMFLFIVVATSTAAAEIKTARIFGEDDMDQDDMAIWIHPTDAAKSTIIGSDKDRRALFVYGIDGKVIQQIDSGKPGNVDIRYGFKLDGQCIDLVAFNDRSNSIIQVYGVVSETRRLVRVDDGTIVTKGNYGFTLHVVDGELFGYTGPSTKSTVRQYQLLDNGAGRISGKLTNWMFSAAGTIEGMVGDDTTGNVYLAEEEAGIWRVNATDAEDRIQIAKVDGPSGLKADVEGLTIYYGPDEQGYLIASNQGAYNFVVFERSPPNALVGEFAVPGVGDSDGIDVTNVSLNGTFSQGMFISHSGNPCCKLNAVHWADIAGDLGLLVDTSSWNPRAKSLCGDLPPWSAEPPPLDPETDTSSSGCALTSNELGSGCLGTLLLLGLFAAYRRRQPR